MLQEKEPEAAANAKPREQTGKQRLERKPCRTPLGDHNEEDIHELHEQDPHRAVIDELRPLRALEQQRDEHEEEPPEDEQPAHVIPAPGVANAEVDRLL